MKLKRIEIYCGQYNELSPAESRDLNLEFAVISRMINLNLKDIDIPNLGQITIRLENIEEVKIIENSSLNKVCYIGRPFKIQDYLKLNWNDRKSYLLNFTFESIKMLSELLGWDYNEFKETEDIIIEKGTKTEFGITKKTFSPNKKNKAFLTIDYINGRDADLYAYVMDKKDVLIKKILIVNLRPVIFYLGELMCDLKWKDNNELEILNVKGFKTYHINIETGYIDAQWKNLTPQMVFSGDWQIPL